MLGNNASGVILSGTSCRYLSRISCSSLRICAAFTYSHQFYRRSTFLARIRVEFNLQFIRIEVSRNHLYSKEMLPIMRLDAYRTNAHVIPMLSDILLPLEQTYANLTIRNRALTITRGSRKIVTLRILADGTGRGELRSEPRHTLADASQPLRGHTFFLCS